VASSIPAWDVSVRWPACPACPYKHRPNTTCPTPGVWLVGGGKRESPRLPGLTRPAADDQDDARLHNPSTVPTARLPGPAVRRSTTDDAPRSRLSNRGRLTTWHNVPAPRDVDRWTISRMESTATHALTHGATHGRTRQAQRAPSRSGATGRLRAGRESVGRFDRRARTYAQPVRPGRGRAVDTSRPGARVTPCPVKRDRPYCRPQITPHPCPELLPCARNRGGVLPSHQPPAARKRRKCVKRPTTLKINSSRCA